ncbi:hypothetical protein DSO57_1010471 [Entomophthora muscae]|uniref:Uncharacterized protein n=1 Tax=Entomophthora muscae TaxID=34485 RepID=A0ACC2TTK1_9FUNG|nr:hypothetical protein DSO57_1010471 [Entomophthora muscae]
MSKNSRLDLRFQEYGFITVSPSFVKVHGDMPALEPKIGGWPGIPFNHTTKGANLLPSLEPKNQYMWY